MKNKLVAVRINEELYSQLFSKAKKSHRSTSQYIRDLIITSIHPADPAFRQTVEQAQKQMESRDEFGRRAEDVAPI